MCTERGTVYEYQGVCRLQISQVAPLGQSKVFLEIY